MKTKEEILSIVTQQVKEYVGSSSKYQTVSSLSRKTGLSYNTIKKIAQESVSYIEEETAFSILSPFIGVNRAVELMKTPYPEWFETYGKYRVEGKRTNPEDCPDFQWTNLSTLLMDMSCQDGGFSEEWLIDCHGRVTGIGLANQMIEAGLIKKSGNSYVAINPDYTDPNPVNVLERILNDVEAFDVNDVGQGAWYQRITEFISLSCSYDLRQLTKEYLSNFKDRIEQDKATDLDKRVFVKLSAVGSFLELLEEKGESQQ